MQAVEVAPHVASIGLDHGIGEIGTPAADGAGFLQEVLEGGREHGVAGIDGVLRVTDEKGFGFIAVVGESDAFMHIRQLEAAGHSSVPEGARVKIRIGQGQKGPEVTELIEVDTGTAHVTSKTGQHSAPRSGSPRQPGVGTIEECIGSVKWYNADKGFGFVGQDGGGKDVFIHATTLERGGLSGLAEGQRVRMQIGQGQKGPEARSIELLD